MEIGLIDVVVAGTPFRPIQQIRPHVEAVFFGFPDFDRVKFTH
jgi:hypothetical protein